MDIENIFSEDTPINIVKTWLCGGTDGQTYPLTSTAVFPFDIEKIEKMGYKYDWACIESEFDEIVGWKHDYKIDDPNLDEKAATILQGISNLTKDCYENPAKYFPTVSVSPTAEIAEDEIVERIVNIENSSFGVISTDYIRPIAEKIAKDVIEDLRITADFENFNDDDVRLAVGRVLCEKLHIEV